MNLIIPIVATFICLLIIIKISKGRTISIITLTTSIYYLSQIVIGLVLFISDPDFAMSNSYRTTIIESLEPFSIGAIFAVWGLLLGVKTSKIAEKETPSLLLILHRVDKNYHINQLLISFLLLFICSILRTFNMGYVVNLIANTFSFITIIVGFFWSRLKAEMKVLWIIVLTITFVFHIIQGSRGYALYPIIFLLFGYLLSLSNNKKLLKKRALIIGLSFILFMPVFSKFQDYRLALGRGLDVTVESLNSMLDFMMNEQYVDDEKSGFSKSLSRFVIETNFATVTLCPEPIPYRGTKSITEELQSMVSLVGSENVEKYRLSRANLNFGQGVPSKFGFNVNEFTSVEFPLYADAYSRFGYIGVFFYFLLFAFFVCRLELFARNLSSQAPLLSLTLFTFFLYTGIFGYGSTYYPLAKNLIYRGIVVVFFSYAVSHLIKKQRHSF